MKYKVADLSGALLDLAVARARSIGPTGETDWLHYTRLEWSPSTNWADGGPIIERERIAVYWHDGSPKRWVAGFDLSIDEGWSRATIELDYATMGPTALVAAMRAFVFSKFGQEVDLEL